MSKRFDTEPGFFGSVAIGNPKSSFAERTLVASVDFGRKEVAENTKVGIMELPAGFLIDRVTVVQTKPVATALVADSTAIKFGPNSDSTVFFGGQYALGATKETFVRSCTAPGAVVQPTVTLSGQLTVTDDKVDLSGGTATASGGSGPGGGYFVSAPDLLCMDVPDGQTGDKIAEGAFEIAVHGYEVAFDAGDGFDGNSLGRKVFRNPLQTAENEAANVAGPQWPID